MILKNLKTILYETIYFKFLRQYKCEKRMFPQVIIIGAQKSGTTSLFNYLISHNKVLKPLKKEIHFFSEYYSKGSRWYKMHFPVHESGKITLEASTSYLIYPHTCNRVYSLLPNAKIIAILRNPIDRAYSHYMHMRRNGKENESSFDKALKKENERIFTSFNKMEKNDNYYDRNALSYAYLKRGLYYEQLKPWFEKYKKNNIYVMESKQFFKDTKKKMSEVYDFLSLQNTGQFKAVIYNKGNHIDDISKNTRDYLQSYYSVANKKLFRLIEKDFEW